jgi:hypothetical protein
MTGSGGRWCDLDGLWQAAWMAATDRNVDGTKLPSRTENQGSERGLCAKADRCGIFRFEGAGSRQDKIVCEMKYLRGGKKRKEQEEGRGRGRRRSRWQQMGL